MISGASLIACQNQYDDLADDLTRQQGIEISEISINNSKELDALKIYLNSPITKTKSGAVNGISFDSTKIKTYHIVNSDLNFYFVPQTDFTEDKNVNFSAAYVMDGEEVKNGIILREELLTDKLKHITYFSMNHTPIIEVVIDKTGKKPVASTFTLAPTTKVSPEGGGMGDCVARCIGDAYLEEGWGSVVLWCATLYCPEVGAAVAIYCASLCGSK